MQDDLENQCAFLVLLLVIQITESSLDNQDGTIWKERVSASVRRRSDLSVLREGTFLESQAAGRPPRPPQSNRLILPSLSAPEHNIINLLEECNSSGIQRTCYCSKLEEVRHSCHTKLLHVSSLSLSLGFSLYPFFNQLLSA